LGRSSRNSSQPPSADPSSAPPRREKSSSGRGRGAQRGHKGHGRDLLPLAAVDEVLEYWPERCDCSHVFLEGERVAAGEPARWQVEELPAMTVRVIEHRAQRLCCPDCGAHTRAVLPAEVTQSAFGAHLQAAIATLSVRNRISRRDVVELTEELFCARISAGTVDAILARASQALAEPHADLLEQLRAAEAVNMDETGWRTAGAHRALWGIFDQSHAYLHIAPGRHEDHAKELLADTNAIVTSDRWWAYAHLPLARRQLCWAHLRRDFAAHTEGLAAEKEFGEHGLTLCERVFAAWKAFTHTRRAPPARADDPWARARVQANHLQLRVKTSAQQALPRDGASHGHRLLSARADGVIALYRVDNIKRSRTGGLCEPRDQLKQPVRGCWSGLCSLLALGRASWTGARGPPSSCGRCVLPFRLRWQRCSACSAESYRALAMVLFGLEGFVRESLEDSAALCVEVPSWPVDAVARGRLAVIDLFCACFGVIDGHVRRGFAVVGPARP
jgi:hypothetical protein